MHTSAACHGKSAELNKIVRTLASVPGGVTVDVVAKAFPQSTGSGTHTHFQQSAESFPVRDVPETLRVDEAVEDIAVILRATLPDPQPRGDLLERLTNLIGALDVGPDWEVRLRAADAPLVGHVESFELTVFNNPAGGTRA